MKDERTLYVPTEVDVAATDNMKEFGPTIYDSHSDKILICQENGKYTRDGKEYSLPELTDILLDENILEQRSMKCSSRQDVINFMIQSFFGVVGVLLFLCFVVSLFR